METSDVLRFSNAEFRSVLGHFPTGVVVVTATTQAGEPVGMTVGSFTSVSLTPPLVAFLPARSSTTFGQIREAGTFCVNVLAADQENLCRLFAQRGAGRFEQIRYTRSPQGSPIIDGAVAWIDCTTDSVVETGDHYICVGRVRGVSVHRPTTPLLFFQGGYGRFAPSSLAAPADEDLLAQLRMADVARPEMERLAAALETQCIVGAVVGNDVVILAAAGERCDGQVTMPIGHRIPFIPPVGTLLAAWGDEHARQTWLRRLGSLTPEQEEHYRALLATVRARGWAASRGTATQRELEMALAALPVDTPTKEDLTAVRASIDRLGGEYDMVEFTRDTATTLSNISAPIFDGRGRAVLQLTLLGLPPVNRDTVQVYVGRLTSACQEITGALGGKPPEQAIG